jgi:hypothetical protein
MSRHPQETKGSLTPEPQVSGYAELGPHISGDCSGGPDASGTQDCQFQSTVWAGCSWSVWVITKTLFMNKAPPLGRSMVLIMWGFHRSRSPMLSTNCPDTSRKPLSTLSSKCSWLTEGKQGYRHLNQISWIPKLARSMRIPGRVRISRALA